MLLLSYVAIRIYKYRMYYRLENIDKSAEGILLHVKSSIFQYSTLNVQNIPCISRDISISLHSI